MAAIREKVPGARLYAVKVFHRKLLTNAETLARAIRWCAQHGIEWINLSLGTANAGHAGLLQASVDEATANGATLVSAFEWFPGNLPPVIPVGLDWECSRDEYRTQALPDGRTLYLASGYPRPLPGVPVERNLKGVSFAVANVT